MVAAAFFASSVVFGSIYSFGGIPEPDGGLFPSEHGCRIRLLLDDIGGLLPAGAPAGRIADHFGPRAIVAVGAVIFGGGLCLTAFVDYLWLAYLTYALGAGVGGACCYVPTLSVMGVGCVRQRNTALEIAAGGTGAGTVRIPTDRRCL